MTAQNVSELTRELRDLLIQERDLLRAGNAVETAALVDRKLEIMRSLNPIIDSWTAESAPKIHLDALSNIQKIASENALHFESVRNGLSSLIERLDANSDVTRIGTYDQHGNQMKFNRGEGGYRKSV